MVFGMTNTMAQWALQPEKHGRGALRSGSYEQWVCFCVKKGIWFEKIRGILNFGGVKIGFDVVRVSFCGGAVLL